MKNLKISSLPTEAYETDSHWKYTNMLDFITFCQIFYSVSVFSTEIKNPLNEEQRKTLTFKTSVYSPGC